MRRQARLSGVRTSTPSAVIDRWSCLSAKSKDISAGSSRSEHVEQRCLAVPVTEREPCGRRRGLRLCGELPGQQRFAAIRSLDRGDEIGARIDVMELERLENRVERGGDLRSAA